YDLFDMVTDRFDKVIVLLNTTTPFQCDFLDDYNNSASDPRIDAVLWIGGPGHTGAEVIGKLLTGEINPSGRTADLYAKDFTKDPTWQNFGDNSQVNGGEEGSAFLENGVPLAGKFLITYEEGIYLGYRYYETRGFEEARKDANSTWYADHVRFPFGYGLSYTGFRQTIDSVQGSLTGPDSRIVLTVTSENTGRAAGKDVFELYVTLPYEEGGIEKSHVQLVDFAKTPLLQPGEKYTATFTVDAYDLASYDYNDANRNGFSGYELDPGEYIFRAGKNSHEYYDVKSVTASEGIRFEKDPATGYPVVNLYTTEDFFDLQYRLQDVEVELPDGTTVTRKGMSRTDFEGTFPAAMSKAEREILTLEAGSEKDALNDFTHNNPRIGETVKMPVTGAEVTVTLRDLTGKAYDDPLWETLLDAVTFREMLDLVNNGDYKTVAIPSIDKNLTNDSDGPLGFVNFMAGLSDHYTGNAQFATEFVIASSWNRDLAYRMGKIIGETGIFGDVDGNGLPYTGWYAPAVNLHRSPFSGRNYEYYSEDPVLTGKMAVNTLNGALRGGVVPEVKHFALNDQETNRSGVSTYCTEQAFRELYLKAFEITVKADDAPGEAAKADGLDAFRPTTGIMSSFNRAGTRWTGGDYRLMTEILRYEWGFRGLVICDYKTDNSFMNSRQMLYAGNDLILTSLDPLKWKDASESDAKDVAVLREATKNILYAMANSNTQNVKIIGYRTEWWRTALAVLDVLAAAGLAFWGIRAFRKARKEEQ
ncbi:MAG: fibronectin type III-like domain-contianing protein, partial [Lachnospiraceae bacterium]|nr:fibronectin type III-like domain-contianing protein [Lachnospiraceae bacterium]